MIGFTLNGKAVNTNASTDKPLLWVLREDFNLTGTKFGCGIAQCGACTVHLNGTPTRSCVLPVSAVSGAQVTTIEAINASKEGKALQDAWIAEQAPQCGYCQSGQIMAAVASSKISRGSFVIGTSAGAIGVSFGAAVSTFAALNATAQTTSFTPIAWVNIVPDNTATIYSPGSEMGQGTKTALPIVIAENMELDWAKCKVVHAPADPKRFGNPKFGGGMITGSSRTVVGYYQALRLSGLQGKLVMMEAAAKAWGVPASEVTASMSMVRHAGSNRSITYGEIAKTAQAPEASYTSEHVAQFTMEPMDCTAKLDGDKIELWVPSQAVAFVVGGVAAVGGFKPENIKVNITLLGGGYGRRVEAEHAVEAMLIAKAVPGVPVQMIWTCEDDMLRSKPRPLTAQHLIASVDAHGFGCQIAPRDSCHARSCKNVRLRPPPHRWTRAGFCVFRHVDVVHQHGVEVYVYQGKPTMHQIWALTPCFAPRKRPSSPSK